VATLTVTMKLIYLFPIRLHEYALDRRMELIDALRQANITEVNGVAVEQFVVSAHDAADFIDITHGCRPRSLKQKKQAYDVIYYTQ